MLVRLVYASIATRRMEPADIRAILESSRRWNIASGVTGMLCHGNNRFMQYIEGERPVINELFGMLHHDERHRALTLLDYAPIAGRQFTTWSLGFISAYDEAASAELQRIAGVPSFLPEQLEAATANALIRELKDLLDPQYETIPHQQHAVH